MEVLRRLVQGLANEEIAVQMDISESTFKNSLQQLFAETAFRTRRSSFALPSNVTENAL